MPLCHFQSSFAAFANLFPVPQTLRDLVLGREMVQPCVSPCRLPCRSLDTSFRPTNQCRTFLSPSPQQYSHHVAVLVSPRFVCLPSKQSINRVKPNSFAQFLALVSGCTLLPISRRNLLQKHFLHIPRANESHVHPTLSFKQSGQESRTLQRLRVLSLVSKSEPKRFAFSKLLFVLQHIFQSTFLLPRLAWPWWKTLPALRDNAPPRTRKAKSTPSCLLLPSASSSLTFPCVQHPLPASHAIAETKPVLNNFLNPILM